jgi:hypothetical protein
MNECYFCEECKAKDNDEVCEECAEKHAKEVIACERCDALIVEKNACYHVTLEAKTYGYPEDCYPEEGEMLCESCYEKVGR